MISGILIRRLLTQSFMRPVLIIKIDPALGFLQKLSQCAIGPAFGYSELKNANKPLCVAIVCRRPCSTHRAHEAFPQEHRSRLLGSILAALIRMKDGARNRELNELDRRNHQIRTHLIVKRQRKAMTCPFPECKAATHFRAIRQLDFKDILRTSPPDLLAFGDHAGHWVQCCSLCLDRHNASFCDEPGSHISSSPA
jgi:hypothetical protein